MRRVFRRDLSPRSRNALNREQTKADTKHLAGELNVHKEWERARKNLPLREAFQVLQKMAGERERCMYCGDSMGTDIEHFWPKAPYPESMFRWSNMLLCCTGCGRIKGAQFPIVENQPVLIDPSIDNPWDFLDFSPDTGNIVPRYDPESGHPLLRGEKTVEVLQLDRREAIARGYKKTFLRIKSVIEDALETRQDNASVLFQRLSEADDHGLLGWCFDGLGSRVTPFSDLQERHPDIWNACCESYRHQ